MKARSTPRISVRKAPQQARSARLVADILEAAVRVLERDGARRFTAARVAERAGVSVGSLYQYFPNKEAILFRLQTEEWQQTGAALQEILDQIELPPLERLRRVVKTFFRTEHAEAALRTALGDAAPLYRDAPEARGMRRSGRRRVAHFMREVLPHVPARQRARIADVILMTMEAIGRQASESSRSLAELDALAGITAEMFCAYLRDCGTAA